LNTHSKWIQFLLTCKPLMFAYTTETCLH